MLIHFCDFAKYCKLIFSVAELYCLFVYALVMCLVYALFLVIA